ncbi:hypothetical protein K490DRAFT_53567 [Saccharata proteae CBS 121410]|uniref:Chromo domain-containing protein n=1 Tax=Saccharata proteae CBS 121410 TaxID=1314787 RepID=A0A9P4M0V6_9PEZI|nr:hypothetical protein K490DRAFT_53567 [Saccharata proteae CBS 121410]
METAPRRKRRVQKTSQHHNVPKRQEDNSPSDFNEGYVPTTDILPIRLYPRSSPPIANARTHIVSRISDNGTPVYTVRIESHGANHGSDLKTVIVEARAILEFVSPAELDRFEFDLFLHPEKDPDARKPKVPSEEPDLPTPKPRRKRGRPRKQKAPSVASEDEAVHTIEGRLALPVAPMLREPETDTGAEDVSRGTNEQSVCLGEIQATDSEDELGLYRAGGAGRPPRLASRSVTNGAEARRPATKTASPNKRQRLSHQLDDRDSSGRDSSAAPNLLSFMSRHHHSPQSRKHTAPPVHSPSPVSSSGSEVDLIPTSPRQPPNGLSHRAPVRQPPNVLAHRPPSRQIAQPASLSPSPDPLSIQIKDEISASVSLSPSPPPRKSRSRSSPRPSWSNTQPESVVTKMKTEEISWSTRPSPSLPAAPPSIPPPNTNDIPPDLYAPPSKPNNITRNASASHSNSADDDDAEADDDEEVFEIEAILRDKPFIGKRWYKVKWAGCAIGEDLDNWVEEDMLSGAKELLDDYMKRRQTVMSKDGPVGFLPGWRRAASTLECMPQAVRWTAKQVINPYIKFFGCIHGPPAFDIRDRRKKIKINFSSPSIMQSYFSLPAIHAPSKTQATPSSTSRRTPQNDIAVDVWTAAMRGARDAIDLRWTPPATGRLILGTKYSVAKNTL